MQKQGDVRRVLVRLVDPVRRPPRGRGGPGPAVRRPGPGGCVDADHQTTSSPGAGSQARTRSSGGACTGASVEAARETWVLAQRSARHELLGVGGGDRLERGVADEPRQHLVVGVAADRRRPCARTRAPQGSASSRVQARLEVVGRHAVGDQHDGRRQRPLLHRRHRQRRRRAGRGRRPGRCSRPARRSCHTEVVGVGRCRPRASGRRWRTRCTRTSSSACGLSRRRPPGAAAPRGRRC